MYDIYIRDRHFNRLAQVTEYDKLEVNLNFNDVGKWVLSLPADTPSAGLIKRVRAQGQGLGGIIVERDGQYLFSGPIQNLHHTVDWLDDGEHLRVEGTDDNGLLARRLAMPPPYIAQAGTGIGYDVFNGRTEAGMIHLVSNNAAVTAPGPRIIAGLTVATNQGRGSQITVRSRYHNLITKLQECARYDDLGFKVVQTGTNLQFQVYQPRDKTQSIVFAPDRGNLEGYAYNVDAPEANFIIGGGMGEETERKFAYLGDEPSRALYGTIEYFDDQRNVEEQEELIEIIHNRMINLTEKTIFKFEPIEVTNSRFMNDYQLGDKVSVTVGGEVIHDLIRGIEIKVDTQDEHITPIVGTPGVGTGFRLFDQFRNLEGRIGEIEKR